MLVAGLGGSRRVWEGIGVLSRDFQVLYEHHFGLRQWSDSVKGLRE